MCTDDRPPIALGLPQWYHNAWPFTPRSDTALSRYSQHFKTVEGNTTFYGLPQADTVRRWQQSVPKHFQFCFKFPRTISHESELQHCAKATGDFLDRMAPLGEQLSLLWLQLGPRFGPDDLPALQRYLDALPADFRYAVEVRHMAFFDKHGDGGVLNRVLADRQVNRTVFDTRTLFANPGTDSDSLDALSKKPQVPTHAVATSDLPMIRFISPKQTSLADAALQRWAEVLLRWHREGKTPHVFLHTPSCAEAAVLASDLAAHLHRLNPQQPLCTAPVVTAEQQALF